MSETGVDTGLDSLGWTRWGPGLQLEGVGL